jgi:hypothetical protein
MGLLVQNDRRTIPMIFSREFEAMLITSDAPHISLTHDLEFAVSRGLEYLQELEDVLELQHLDRIKSLVASTNNYLHLTFVAFHSWYLQFSTDLIDEIDQIMLVHGEDLINLGLRKLDLNSVVILLANAGLSGSLQG